MDIIENILSIIGVITVIYVIGKALWKRHIKNNTQNILIKVMPVWASLGPFSNGTESALAMNASYIAVLGSKESEEKADVIESHEDSFNKEPAEWERVRRISKRASREINDFITIAEEIYDKHVGYYHLRLIDKYGKDIFHSMNKSAIDLCDFIVSTYSLGDMKLPEAEQEIGYKLVDLISFSDKNPTDDISIKFKDLYNKYIREYQDEGNSIRFRELISDLSLES